MHDLIIEGGTIVDGSGAPAFTGDVVIDGERITAITRSRDTRSSSACSSAGGS